LKLFPYQIDGVKALISKTRFLLRDEPGLGKTAQLINACKVIAARNVLVICPKSMVLTWRREINTWWPGTTDFTVINHDKLIGREFKGFLRAWDVVIADESHMYLKNGATQRAKAFMKIIPNSKRVWLATATVASKSAEDYHCTLKILLPDLMKDWKKDKFLKRYCKKIPEPFSYSGYKYEGFQNMEELHKVFSKCSLKRTEKEVSLELPELTETDIPVEVVCSMTPEEKEDLKNRIIAGENISPSYQEKLRESGLGKISSVIELLNTYPPDKKVVVFAWHREVVQQLKLAIEDECESRTCSVISGEVTSSEERQQRIDAFQTGSLNTLLVNISSGGAGITLTAATVGIYVQFPHSVIHWVQSRKRIHRIGSKKPVQIIKLMAKGVDEEIFKVLSERASYIKEVEG